MAQEALSTPHCTPGYIILLEIFDDGEYLLIFYVPGGIGEWWEFCLEVRFLEVHLLGQFEILVQNSMIALYFYLSPMLNRTRFTFDLLPIVENKLFF